MKVSKLISMTSALEGIKILDLSWTAPGPYCSMLLADLGAEVIKVEEPRRGDYARLVPPFIGKESALFLSLNRNKKSITLNLRSDKGRDIFYRLAEKSDVVLEGFRPGVAKRLGLDYDSIQKINPKIIYCSITGYGQDGPYSDFVGHDPNYIGIAGILSLSGVREGPPPLPGIAMADFGGGGMFAAIGILTAIIAREKNGLGQYIDVSMLDGLISWVSSIASMYLAERKPPGRGEMVLSGGMPYVGVYETEDEKFITIAAVEAHFWRNLCRVIGREDLIEHQFATGKKREEIFSTLKEIFRTKTRDEWFNLMTNSDVPCGPVYALDEVFKDPQVLHRGLLTEIDHPTVEKIKQIRCPLKFSETPAEIRSPPPLLGQHTREILQTLGCTEAEIEDMRKTGVI